jgi:hypothetical protein
MEHALEKRTPHLMIIHVRAAIYNTSMGYHGYAMEDLSAALRTANSLCDNHAKASILRMMNWLRAADITNIDNSGEAPC